MGLISEQRLGLDSDVRENTAARPRDVQVTVCAVPRTLLAARGVPVEKWQEYRTHCQYTKKKGEVI